jgi:WD40 repeat protein
VVVSEIATGAKVRELEAPVMYTWDPVQRRHSIGGIRSLAFSPDGARLAVGGMGQVGNIDHLDGLARVEVFDLQNGQRTHEFPGEKVKGLVEHLAFTPDGKWLVIAGGNNEGFLTVLSLESTTPLREEKAGNHVHSFVVNSDFDTLFLVGHERISQWEMKAQAG